MLSNVYTLMEEWRRFAGTGSDEVQDRQLYEAIMRGCTGYALIQAGFDSGHYLAEGQLTNVSTAGGKAYTIESSAPAELTDVLKVYRLVAVTTILPAYEVVGNQVKFLEAPYNSSAETPTVRYLRAPAKRNADEYPDLPQHAYGWMLNHLSFVFDQAVPGSPEIPAAMRQEHVTALERALAVNVPAKTSNQGAS